ncbi:hypothetical protein TeGR_g11908 [Tetraparma gracilis]|uniref:SRCR domain-containing protein n=1 Tax=Tetraparma gracilis TaxID=2962635 RepID=A0ABQ6MZI2_9STRA|nr:hypothetical protein TeGR_g11908 [Tetraparma gracilis]
MEKIELTDPLCCLGGPIRSRVTNAVAAKNAARLVDWSRWGLLLDTLLRCYVAAEWFYVARTWPDPDSILITMAYIFVVLHTVQLMMGVSLMLDAKSLLEETRDRRAKVFCLFGSKTSLFGWVYMKLKAMIMIQAMWFLYTFTLQASYSSSSSSEVSPIRLQTGEITQSIDSEGRMQGRIEVLHDGQWGTVCGSGWMIDYYTWVTDVADEANLSKDAAYVACRQLRNQLQGSYVLVDYDALTFALLVYLVIYHCLKRIDQDDRRNVYPNHDYKADAVCCRVTPLLALYWLFYTGFFLFFFALMVLLAVGDETGGNFAALAALLFGSMIAHQIYYNRTVAPEQPSSR